MEQWLRGIRALFRSRAEIYDDAAEGRQFDAIYFAMLVLGCLIALLGLLLNSPAVIIGAMLISPLMGPILSCGLALTVADWALGKKAARNVVLSIGETILIAVVATLLSPLKDATPEILARTNPNLMDLLIAFFSGAAGTLALCSRKSALMILPGVAIATAVMPPLATTGYGISTGQWAIARGAFMLFFTNLMAIIISADIVFLLVGFRPAGAVAVREHATFVRGRLLIAGGVLIVLSIPLIRTLTHAAQQANYRKQVQAALSEQMLQAPERKLDRVSLQLRENELAVEVAVETPQFIEPQEIKTWEAAIQSRVGRPVRLELEQLQLARKPASDASQAGPNQDYLGGGTIKPVVPAEQQLSAANELEQAQSRIQSSLSQLLRPLGAQEVSIEAAAARPDHTIVIAVAATVPQPVTPEAWQVVTAAVSREFSSAVQLTANLSIGEPVLLRFHPKSLRLRTSDRRTLTQMLARWSKRGDIHYRLAPASSADAQVTATRVSLLKKRSPRIEVADLPSGPADSDTIILRAAQRLSAQIEKPENPAGPGSTSPGPGLSSVE
jgi:uncharacterized hydrophobic protein (TIGR00271 family)